MRYAIFVLGTLMVCAAPAAAQVRGAGGQAFVSINGGVQVAANDFDDSATFSQSAETGRFGADYTVDSGPSLNIGGGAVVWRQLAAGIGITRFSRSTPAALSGSVPHPFFFNRGREIAAAVAGLDREELAIHFRAAGVFRPNNRLEVVGFGGPSFFRVRQGIVRDFVYAEEYPYDAVSFVRADVTTVEESALGFNAGADVAYFFTQRLGVGVAIQFAGAQVDVPSANGGTQSVDAGGLHIGGGLRLRF